MKLKLFYLHGFLSVPNSSKGRILERVCREEGWDFEAPDLNRPPLESEALIDSLVAARPAPVVFVGSSMGGYWAGRWANRTGGLAVLLNPCLDPWNFIAGKTGRQQIFGTDRFFDVKPEFADDLQRLAEGVDPVPKRPERTLLMVGTADDVIDWRRTLLQLPRVRTLVSAGDGHRLFRFESNLAELRLWVRSRAARLG